MKSNIKRSKDDLKFTQWMDKIDLRSGRVKAKKPVNIDYDLVLTSYGDVRPDILFHAHVAKNNLDHMAFSSRNYEPFDVDKGYQYFIDLEDLEILSSARYEKAQHILAQINGVLMMLRINNNRIAVDAASANPHEAWETVSNLLDAFPFDQLQKSKTRIPIYFWGEGSAMSRSIPIVAWNDEIKMNYSKEIIDSVDAAVKSELPEGLIIWHGPPGTGKTSALRALISQREENTVHYITDPEVLVNRADYMYSILEYASNRGDEDKETLIICEDSGPLVTDQSGMELGRILNLADGILGQGFNLRLLFTTNDPINNFHPAVLRPGRCAQELEFGKLSRQEVNAWCDFHDRPRINEEQTLAWLYANIHEKKVAEVGQYL